jgi:hypothetical protein
MKKLALFVSLAALLTVMVGCSALNNALKKAGNGNGNSTSYDLSGSWEVVATSTQNQGVVSYVEFNATQQGNGNITAPAQEFIFGTPATVLGNCFGVIPGNPQGNVSATVDNSSSNITGTFTETSPTQDSASFSIQAPLASKTTFSGNFIGATTNSTACADAGTFVATKTSSLSGNYSGQLTYPDGSVETVSATMTEDPAYNVTVTGTATGGMQDGPLNFSGNVVGNLAVLHGTSKNGNPLTLFAWWNTGQPSGGATFAALEIVDTTGYTYGALARQ